MQNIQLSVAFVEFGGNINSGKYFFCFSPETIIVTQPNQPIVVSFTKSTADRFQMVDFITTDAEAEFTDVIYRNKQRTLQVTDINTKKQLINVSVLIKDTVNDELINCDPQVLNSPDP